MELIAFYVLAALAVTGAVLMVTRRNPLNGAFALILSLVAVAGLFAMLHAEFMFILQILLYAGAIMVLIIFTIMLLNLSKQELYEPPVGRIKGFIILVASLVGLMGFIRVFRGLPALEGEVDPTFGHIEPVGELLLGNYLYPFEIISVLLLVAVVGVVLLAKKVI
jgi:NADH-quinone oxidoreductase subunit J